MQKQKISGDELAVGGQAVLEGVMMRGLNSYAVAVRAPSGKIKTLIKDTSKPSKFKLLLRKIPFIRGIFIMFDSLQIGYKALDFSADVAIEEENPIDSQDTKKSSDGGVFIIFTLILSVIFAIGLFKFLPFFISGLIVQKESHFFVWLEGLIKISVFIIYLLIISTLKDIKRVFQYHGAEHKAVHCYEKFGIKGLNIKNTKACSRIHKRCGTTFLFLVIFVSIIVYAIIPIRFNFWTSFGLRILFLPIIAGMSYEILKLVPKLKNNNPIKWILMVIEFPGLMIQKITTKEPSEDQLEVAIFALKKVL